MAKKTRDTAIRLVLGHEGGFVNHPRDPGGATNKGITRKTLSNHYGRAASIDEVRSMPESVAVEIYRKKYWNLVWGDRLPAGVDYAVMDYAVNSGPAQAIRDLQRVVGVRVDGVIGENTLAAVRNRAQIDEESLIDQYCEKRYRFLRSLRTWGTFGKGWTRRVMGRQHGFQQNDLGVVDYATRMAKDDLEFVTPVRIGMYKGEQPGKADPANVALAKTNKGKALGLTLVSGGGEQLLSLGERVQFLGGYSTILQYVAGGLMVVGVGWLVYETIVKPVEEQKDEVPVW